MCADSQPTCGPKVIFLSFTFLCLLLSLHPLMYLVLPLPPHSLLLLLSPSSRLSAGLARHTFRYSCLRSPSLTSDSYTALAWLLLSYQLVSGLTVSIRTQEEPSQTQEIPPETEKHFANICLSAGRADAGVVAQNQFKVTVHQLFGVLSDR